MNTSHHDNTEKKTEDLDGETRTFDETPSDEMHLELKERSRRNRGGRKCGSGRSQ